MNLIEITDKLVSLLAILPPEAWGVIFKGYVTLLVGMFVAQFGLHIYFKQKEYELVKSRYLEGSIDILASELENSLSLLKHNWSRYLNILKVFRDTPKEFDTDELRKGFIDFEMNFYQTAHYRLQNLIGTPDFWYAYQLALSFVATNNSIITKEMTEVIKLTLDGSTGKSVEKTYEFLKEKIIEIDKEEKRYYLIPHQLKLIVNDLEKEKMSFSTLSVFRDNPTVKSAISAIKIEFEKDYKEKLED